MSRRFKIFIAVICLGVVLFAIVLNAKANGSQYVASPDGKFVLRVTSRLYPSGGDGYEITLENPGVETPLVKLVYSRPNAVLPGPRDVENLIQWDPDSRHADLVLKGEVLCRVSVPR